MKPSKYNYYIPYKDKYIVFNGVTKRFFFISDKNQYRLVSILDEPNSVSGDGRFTAFLDRMAKEGFLVEEDDSEEDSVKKLFERERCPDQYMLMILPTYKCNLRCWYCIQDHKDANLTDTDVERIKKHIARSVKKEEIKQFRLSWFGGEPLLAYDKIVSITKSAKHACEKESVDFFCDITTNGLLLDHERIKVLGETGVQRFQITIDGCREKHNVVKKNKTNTAFDEAVSNILDIVKTIPDVLCVLRINYSDETMEPKGIIEDISNVLPKEYRKSVRISPCKIWQVEESNETKEKVSELNALARRKNYKINLADKGMCYVDYANFNCIFPNGLVGKCDNDKIEEAKGILTDKGEIVWKEPYPFETASPLSDGCVCASCKHLPFCMGPCPQKRNDMLMEHGKVVCQYHDADRSVTEWIVRYCENNSNVSL